MGKVITEDLEQEILELDNPVVFGVDSYLTGGCLLNGPKIIEVGEDVTVIANFKNDSYLVDTPSITYNKFGNGKVVLFSPHPEIRDPDLGPKYMNKGTEGTYNGKKLISNAFFFASSDDETDCVLTNSRESSYITDIWNLTADLSSLLNESVEVFEELKTDIDNSLIDVVNITEKFNYFIEEIQQIAIDEGRDLDEVKKSLYNVGNLYGIYLFELMEEYLKKYIITLQTIEKIYPLLEENNEFLEEIQVLKNDLELKIGKIQEILSKSKINIEKMEKILENYQNIKIFRSIQEKLFKKTSHDIEKQADQIFEVLPIGYFDSLKLLRNYWYEYETGLIN